MRSPESSAAATSNAGFATPELRSDGEHCSMMNKVKDDLDLDLKMKFVSAQRHAPEADQTNWRIKEQIRAARQRLPREAQLHEQ